MRVFVCTCMYAFFLTAVIVLQAELKGLESTAQNHTDAIANITSYCHQHVDLLHDQLGSMNVSMTTEMSSMTTNMSSMVTRMSSMTTQMSSMSNQMSFMWRNMSLDSLVSHMLFVDIWGGSTVE